MCRPKTEPSLVLNVRFWFLNCSEGEFGAGGCEHPDYASNASCVRGVCQLPLFMAILERGMEVGLQAEESRVVKYMCCSNSKATPVISALTRTTQSEKT
jgi:hypothetical protein